MLALYSRVYFLFSYRHLRARRALLQLKDVQLRTRRAQLLYKVNGNSALLALNGTSLICNSALLALSWRYFMNISQGSFKSTQFFTWLTFLSNEIWNVFVKVLWNTSIAKYYISTFTILLWKRHVLHATPKWALSFVYQASHPITALVNRAWFYDKTRVYGIMGNTDLARQKYFFSTCFGNNAVEYCYYSW